MNKELNAFEFPLNPNYTRFLFYSSFMIGISSLIAFYMQDTILTIFLFLLFLTSINYWRKPEYGLRRKIDMFLSLCSSIYFISVVFLFFPEFNRVVYLNSIICIGVFYLFEYVLAYYKIIQWIVFHMAMHIYAAFFSVIVFSVFLEQEWDRRGIQLFSHDGMVEMVNYVDSIIEDIEYSTIKIIRCICYYVHKEF